MGCEIESQRGAVDFAHPGCTRALRRDFTCDQVHADVAPGALLLAALQGFGKALGIEEFASVSSTTHRYSVEEQFAPHVESNYDGFFEALGVPRTPYGYFSSPIPMEDKPLAQIKKGHKIRTKEKRAFKEDVQNAVAGFFEKHCAADVQGF